MYGDRKGLLCAGETGGCGGYAGLWTGSCQRGLSAPETPEVCDPLREELEGGGVGGEMVEKTVGEVEMNTR